MLCFHDQTSPRKIVPIVKFEIADFCSTFWIPYSGITFLLALSVSIMFARKFNRHLKEKGWN